MTPVLIPVLPAWKKWGRKKVKNQIFFFATDGAACSAEASTTLVDTTHIISLGKWMMTIIMILIEMVMVMMMMMIEMVMILRGCPPTCHVPNHSDQMSLPPPTHTPLPHSDGKCDDQGDEFVNPFMGSKSLQLKIQIYSNLPRKRHLPCKFVAWAMDKQQRRVWPHLSCPCRPNPMTG